ncbi:hypothetical protein C8Q76DRAFT_747353 [Earliella scabrosa]|nr:hypothetical protein C8Q76DRAFT_747353 [Earliella scabrosa]
MRVSARHRRPSTRTRQPKAIPNSRPRVHSPGSQPAATQKHDPFPPPHPDLVCRPALAASADFSFLMLSTYVRAYVPGLRVVRAAATHLILAYVPLSELQNVAKPTYPHANVCTCIREGVRVRVCDDLALPCPIIRGSGVLCYVRALRHAVSYTER